MSCATCLMSIKRERRFSSGGCFLRRIETGKTLCYSYHEWILERGHKGSLDVAHIIYLNIITIIGMFFISVVIIALILRKIQYPLRRLKIAAQRVEMGNLVLGD